MKKIIWIILIVMTILFFTDNLLAEKINKIWEKEFDENLEDVILEEVEMSVEKAQSLGIKGLIGKPTDKIKIKYPKILITKNAIKFIKDNQIKKEIPIGEKIRTYLVKSPNEKIIGYYKSNLKIPTNEKEYGIIESTFLNVLDINGNEILNKTFKGGFGFIVSDQGNFVAFGTGSEGYGKYIYFYDSRGNLIKQVDPFEKKGYFSYTGKYSKTDKYVAISFNKFGDLGGAFILFDSQGNELWRKKFSDWHNSGYHIIISADEKYIYTAGIIFINNTTNKPVYYSYCFTDSGDNIFSNDIGATGDFSSDGAYLILATKRIGIKLFDVKNNKVLWQFKDPDQNIFINAIDISTNANYVTSMWRSTDKEKKKIIIFNKQGEIIFKQDYISEDKSTERISIKIEEAGKKVYLIHGKKLEILEISQ